MLTKRKRNLETNGIPGIYLHKLIFLISRLIIRFLNQRFQL